MVNSRNTRWWVAASLAVTAAAFAAWAQLDAARSPKLWRAAVIATYPHDPAGFTQGLAFHAGALYEGTGLYGASSIRKVDIATGRIEKRRPLADNLFGEGITVLDNRLYQLTWRSQIGLVYDIDTFNVLGTFRYRGEGWGLTHDGRHLIMSDGTATLQFLDPTSFEVVERVTVHAGEQPVTRLNELEYVEGEVWANVWYEDRIVRIDPANGEVLGWIDLGNLYTGPGRGGEQVLNGIAFDAETSRLLVTGKNWPQLYEIEVVSQ